MAGKQIAGDGLPSNLTGMSKNQLYDIMSQMKNLIEQNHHQARQILIQNPLLTKALFQAQIMLGMVQPSQAVPKLQPPVSQNTHHSVQPMQQSNIQHASVLPAQGSVQDQPSVSQTQIPPRRHQNQPSLPISSAAVPPLSHQSQPMPAHSLQTPQQPKGHFTRQMAPVSLPQSSQLQNVPPPSLHSSSQPLHQTKMPTASGQLQQPLQAPGFPHMPLQPPLPPHIRPSSVPVMHHQYPPQKGTNLGFQHGAASHNLPQSMFHAGAKTPVSVGPTFLQGQTPLPSQPPTQSAYQVGGEHLGPDFGNQAGNASIQVERGSSWMTGPPENVTQLSGPPLLVPDPMGTGNQPPRAAAVSPEMEKALLQQVMSLTMEQINLLPPEQRNQVLQLQQVLRQ
ncbi:hypothetical protein L6164_005307 [Bauhinia variegata]|uniref:Uncharacterized protein n=1 Tax=Bauhinia variegata TaxID=167791 RepID=A0ACB9PQW8_BAUVA|nr:hypothetical protein L6164_005307 [Bauhinia variegata]